MWDVVVAAKAQVTVTGSGEGSQSGCNTGVRLNPARSGKAMSNVFNRDFHIVQRHGCSGVEMVFIWDVDFKGDGRWWS